MPQQYILSVSHPSIYPSIPSPSNRSIFIPHTYNSRGNTLKPPHANLNNNSTEKYKVQGATPSIFKKHS